MVLVIVMKTIFVFNAIKGDIFPSTKLCFFFHRLKLTLKLTYFFIKMLELMFLVYNCKYEVWYM